MFNLANQDILVLGLDAAGCAAAELLLRQGARVVALDSSGRRPAQARAEALESGGAKVFFGAAALPERNFNLAVRSPVMSAADPLVQAALRRHIPLISELELAFRQAQCLTLAVAGSNGKSTTAELIARMLANNDRRYAVVGDDERPACAPAAQARDLDFLVFNAGAAQLEHTEAFRPAVAVLLNLVPPQPGANASPDDYVRANARLFDNQQAFDWAIIQTQALAQLRALDLPVPAKVVTFSATDQTADLYLDRGLLISRLESWRGPLLDLDHCELRGPHFAEDLMAALAVGHALRLPLERMTDPLKTCPSGSHRFELLGEIKGVQFINDAKSANVDALHKALLAARPAPGGEPNIWLIAGGRDDSLDFHYVGPALSNRVKRAFLLGAAAEKIRAAWSLFTPCTVAASLVEAVREAVRSAGPGDVVLFSPACSGLEQFRNYHEAGESFCAAVKSISSGASAGHPHMHGEMQVF